MKQSKNIAFQIYETTKKNGFGYYECLCSECGGVVYSNSIPSERDRCPCCGERFELSRSISLVNWLAIRDKLKEELNESNRDNQN